MSSGAHMKQCSFCEKSVYKLAARGLCANCYYREKRNGTPDYVKVRKPCSIEGCDALSVAQQLCEMHYRRLKRRGTVEAERFDRWGHAEAHPLYHSHRNVLRSPIGVDDEWRDFWNFVRSVGDRPGSKHRLRRFDQSKPWGPENFFWKAPDTDASNNTLEERREWQRIYRLNNPEKFKDSDLRRSHGISLDGYTEKLVSQGGVCAICRGPEKRLHRGQVRNLAVDHCHKHGHMRGLLCGDCNTALGLFQDNPELLLRAASYLSSHSPEET
jgi:hypothetical protein